MSDAWFDEYMYQVVVNKKYLTDSQLAAMDLEADLSSAVLPGDWVSPYYELDDEAVLELVNGLDVYEEEVPAWALDIRHP